MFLLWWLDGRPDTGAGVLPSILSSAVHTKMLAWKAGPAHTCLRGIVGTTAEMSAGLRNFTTFSVEVLSGD